MLSYDSTRWMTSANKAAVLTTWIFLEALPANASKKIRVVSTAAMFADVIRRVESYESISSLFK